jgi:metallo-beta-lactamase family protein
MGVDISFLDGASTVTSSQYLVRHAGRGLLVDCGLFQGYKQLRLCNWNPIPIVPHQVDAAVPTHAHPDQTGYLPLLAKQGFAGPVYASQREHPRPVLHIATAE